MTKFSNDEITDSGMIAHISNALYPNKIIYHLLLDKYKFIAHRLMDHFIYER